VLVVLGVAAVFDFTARRRAQAAYAKLQARDIEGMGTSPAVVRQLLGREPDGPAKQEKGELLELYSWQGVRKYTVYVLYYPAVGADGQQFTMDTATLNQAP
jgi:hypothetical protein